MEAPDEAAALAAAAAYDASRGGSVEQRLFAAAYRGGALGLPGDELRVERGR